MYEIQTKERDKKRDIEQTDNQKERVTDRGRNRECFVCMILCVSGAHTVLARIYSSSTLRETNRLTGIESRSAVFKVSALHAAPNLHAPFRELLKSTLLKSLHHLTHFIKVYYIPRRFWYDYKLL